VPLPFQLLGPFLGGIYQRLKVISFDVPDCCRSEGSEQSCSTMTSSAQPSPAASLGPNLGGPGTDTKGEFVPLTGEKTETAWGIVHLYREPHEPGVTSTSTESLSGSDGTILCIPAVPGYLSPVGFLNFVGHRWMSQVAHYRMLMTSAPGTFMVLIKCRDHLSAEAWRKEFDGKTFGPMRVSSVGAARPEPSVELLTRSLGGGHLSRHLCQIHHD
jgi:hypothetical protein